MLTEPLVNLKEIKKESVREQRRQETQQDQLRKQAGPKAGESQRKISTKKTSAKKSSMSHVFGVDVSLTVEKASSKTMFLDSLSFLVNGS